MATIELSSILDFKAAGPLKADIRSHAGGELELDASKVERLGGLCLQVLVAAAAAWRAASQNFKLINVGEAFRKDARLLGATGLLPGLE
jgi:chemotaxis protein CheX